MQFDLAYKGRIHICCTDRFTPIDVRRYHQRLVDTLEMEQQQQREAMSKANFKRWVG